MAAATRSSVSLPRAKEVSGSSAPAGEMGDGGKKEMEATNTRSCMQARMRQHAVAERGALGGRRFSKASSCCAVRWEE